MMPNTETIGLLDVTKLRVLALPSEQYAVFGSGPMAAAGIRQSGDIDLIMTPQLYDKLRSGGKWSKKKFDDGKEGLVLGNIEACKTWNYGTYRPDVTQLIAGAEMIEGIPFISLAEVRVWKAAFGREKDKQDVGLIDALLE